jgi:hypothetical protein
MFYLKIVYNSIFSYFQAPVNKYCFRSLQPFLTAEKHQFSINKF